MQAELVMAAGMLMESGRGDDAAVGAVLLAHALEEEGEEEIDVLGASTGPSVMLMRCLLSRAARASAYLGCVRDWKCLKAVSF